MGKWDRAATVAFAARSALVKSKFEDWHPLLREEKKGMTPEEYFKAQEKPASTERLTVDEQMARIKAFRRRGGWSRV
jgi:hypothetical protein